MSFTRWLRNLASVSDPSRASAKRRPGTQFRPHLEPLEDRLTPAGHVWQGGISSLWSDAGNWQFGGTPYGDPDADLIFPASDVARFTSTHDLPGTVTISTISMQGGYTLNGGPVNISKVVGNLGSNTIDFQHITFLSSDQGFAQAFSVLGTLNVKSPILETGTLPLTVERSGTLILSANNTFTSGLNVFGSKLVVGSDTALGSGELTIQSDFFSGSPGRIESSTTVNLRNRLNFLETSIIGGSNDILFLGDTRIALNAKLTVTNTQYTLFNGILFGPGSIVKTGAGDLYLRGVNTYESGTEMQGGTLRVEGNSALGRGTLKLSGGAIQGGALDFSDIFLSNHFEASGGAVTNQGFGTLTFTGPGTLMTGAILSVFNASVSKSTFSGVLSGQGSLTKEGDGLLVLSGTAANTYTGATKVNAGTLFLNKSAGVTAIAGPLTIGDGLGGVDADVVSLGAPNQIADNVAITFDASGLLKMNNFSDAVGSLAKYGHVETADPPTLTVGFNNLSTTFDGVISGPGTVVKVGAGTWTLTGTNTYTGGTVVEGGTLLVDGSIGAVLVNAGATLGGAGTTGPVNLSAGAVISPGGSAPGIQRVQDLAFAAGSSYSAQLDGPAPGTGYDQLDVTGTVSLNGATLDASLGFSPTPGAGFVIIQNDGADRVDGIFAGLPQGASFQIGGVAFHIYYDHGDGNDVVLVRNQPPIASAGGPYAIGEGDPLTLDASASFDPDGDPLTYSWDVNGDGAFGDATGVMPTLTWSQLVGLGIDDGPKTFATLVRVDDGLDAATSPAATLTLRNVAPTASVAGPASGVRGQPRSFLLGALDPSPVDQAAGFTYVVTWGDGTSDTIPATASNGAGTSVEHIFTANGSYTVRVTAMDKDDGTSAEVAHGITITAVALQPNPFDPTKMDLVAGGTLGDDRIHFNPAGLSGVRVEINQEVDEVIAATGRLVVYAQAGDDDVQVAGAIGLPAWLFGGEGDDRLNGGNGANVLVGGNGADQLIGGNSRDIMIGGNGADRLVGNSGDDLLIAGFTKFDANETALAAVLTEWTSGRSYKERVANLRSGQGPVLGGSGFTLQKGTSVFDDRDADVLTGSAGQDWLLFDPVLDVLTDYQSGEEKN